MKVNTTSDSSGAKEADVGEASSSSAGTGTIYRVFPGRKDEIYRAIQENRRTELVGSKHAVEGITKSVALETVTSGIRVNGVAPGPIDTGMLTRFTRTPERKAALVTTVPMDRLGLSEEVANAIVFIASHEASFITGHVLNVDGGKSH